MVIRAAHQINTIFHSARHHRSRSAESPLVKDASVCGGQWLMRIPGYSKCWGQVTWQQITRAHWLVSGKPFSLCSSWNPANSHPSSVTPFSLVHLSFMLNSWANLFAGMISDMSITAHSDMYCIYRVHDEPLMRHAGGHKNEQDMICAHRLKKKEKGTKTYGSYKSDWHEVYWNYC